MSALIRLLSYLTVSATVASCSPITGAIREALDQPDVNPAARDVLRITVVGNAAVDIRLQATYGTTHRDCEVQKFPANPPVGHSKKETIEVPTRKDGATVEVLLDKYMPGRCGWAFGTVGIGAVVPPGSDQGWSSVLTLNSKGKVPDKPLRVVCRWSPVTRTVGCHSGFHYVRSDVRSVTIETAPDWERPSK